MNLKVELFYANYEDDQDTIHGGSGRQRPSMLPMMSRKQSVVSTGDTFLDMNHTHFILVDDGSENQFGKEIEFRANLENELRKGRSLKYYQQRRLRLDDAKAEAAVAAGPRPIDGGQQPPLATHEEDDDAANDEDSTKELVPVNLSI